MHAGSRPQHAAREGGVIGVGLEGLDLVGDPGEREREETLVGADVDRGAARLDDLAEHIQLVLAPGRLVGDPSPVIERGRHQQRGETLFQRQSHGSLLPPGSARRP